MDYEFAKSGEQLSNMINAAIETANTMKTKVQVVSVAVLYHAWKHGDWTFANTLVEGLGHGVKRDSLVEWFRQYGGLIVGDNAGEGFVAWSGPEHIKENFEAAKEKMWYDLNKSSGFSGFRLEDELQKLLDRYNKNAKKLDKLDPEDREKVDLEAKEETIKRFLQMTAPHFFEVIDGGQEGEQEEAA